jgi:ribosomal-protein-alanine N-acetyltransferase
VNATDFTLRKMRMEDVGAVHSLEMDIFTTPWSLNSYQFEVGENNASEPWLAEAQDANGRPVIAGYIVPWLLIDEVHIANLAVATSFRRMGLARRLLQQALERAATKGARKATLEVRAGNQAALALYESFGFRPVGRRKRYYHDNGEDALLMLLDKLPEPDRPKVVETQ